ISSESLTRNMFAFLSARVILPVRLAPRHPEGGGSPQRMSPNRPGEWPIFTPHMPSRWATLPLASMTAAVERAAEWTEQGNAEAVAVLHDKGAACRFIVVQPHPLPQLARPSCCTPCGRRAWVVWRRPARPGH